MIIALFQNNSIPISQGRQNSIKRFQFSKNVCPKVFKKAYQNLNKCALPYLLKKEVICN